MGKQTKILFLKFNEIFNEATFKIYYLFKKGRELPKFKHLFKKSAFAFKNTEYTNELNTLIIDSRLKMNVLQRKH